MINLDTDDTRIYMWHLRVTTWTLAELFLSSHEYWIIWLW